MRRAALVIALAATGCPTPQKPEQPPAPPEPLPSLTEQRVRTVELEAEILASYERDEPPEISMTMIPPRIDAQKVAHPIAPLRIGVGPGDLLIVDELVRAPSRWPLDVGPAFSTEARSKRLEVHLSRDGTAAWVYDEVSWRLSSCGRTAVIPMRLTAMYAYAGEHWVPVFEHLSFARTPVPLRPDQLAAKTIPTEIISRDLADNFSTLLSTVLARRSDTKTIATGPEAMLVGPDIFDEWRGNDVLTAKLAGDATLKLEDRRIGVVGSSAERATMAYWVGNVDAKLPSRAGAAGGTTRMRATFVFELRRINTVEHSSFKSDPANNTLTPENPSKKPKLEDVSCGENPTNCEWVIVQGHVSEPITDEDLATSIFGTALVSPKPVEITCDDGSVRAPGAVPRAPNPPAARSP
jgi:hypothetical protein